MAKPKAIKPLGSTSKYVRMALVCPSGFGKTVFGATAPRALVLTTDPEGTLSAARMGIGKGNDEWAVRYWEKQENEPGEQLSMEDVYDYMLSEGCQEYDWLVHDNATEEQNFAMARAMKIALARPGNKQDKYIPDKMQYQRSQNSFVQMTKMFIDLPINQIWTVHRTMMTTTQADGDEIEFYSANIQGKNGAIAEQFLGYMNIIAHGEVKEQRVSAGDKVAIKRVRRYYFTHTGPYRGKDRFHALGNYKDDLTVPQMMEIIEAGGARGRSPVRKTATRKRVARTA